MVSYRDERNTNFSSDFTVPGNRYNKFDAEMCVTILLKSFNHTFLGHQ